MPDLLDSHAHAVRAHDRVRHVPAVDRDGAGVGGVVALAPVGAVVQERVRLDTPRQPDIVLGAGTDDGRVRGVVIQPDLELALAPPARIERPHADYRTQVVDAPLA